MPNQVILHELKRPNASIPWAYEYIINNKDEELNTIRNQYCRLRDYANGTHGWKSEYVLTSDPNIIYAKFTYFNATTESVNHQALLYYRRILNDVKEWHEWNILYNKMYGIIKTKIDSHNTPTNSILNYGDYGSVETFGLKFQTRV
jgi:hypothetical protein